MTGRWWAGVPGADVRPDAHLLAAVDAALAGTGAAADVVCTHVDRSTGAPEVGVSLRLSGRPVDPDGALVALSRELGGPVVRAVPPSGHGTGPALTALREATDRTAGRCVRFPGQAGVTGRVRVADLVAGTAIEQVVAFGTPVEDDAVVDTAGFLRPTWGGGRLTLQVERAAGGVFQPFEVEFPHQCCGGH